MSQEGGGFAQGEALDSFLWVDQLWNFSSSNNSWGSELKEKKNLQLQPNQIGEEKKLSNDGAIKEISSKGEDEDVHRVTERERRKKMRNMFSNLHSLLPQLPSKADKSTIVDEAANYIKNLQQTLENLEKQKSERIQGLSATSIVVTTQTQAPTTTESREAFLVDQGKISTYDQPTSSPAVVSIVPRFTECTFRTWSSPNVTLSVAGEDAHVNICAAKSKPGLLSLILDVMEKYQLEVVSAHVSSDYFKSMYMIHANGSRVQIHQFPETLMIEEVYKLAAQEMMILLSTY